MEFQAMSKTKQSFRYGLIIVIIAVIVAAGAILGIGMFALPTGILGAGFVEVIQQSKEPKRTCPHCGKSLD